MDTPLKAIVFTVHSPARVEYATPVLDSAIEYAQAKVNEQDPGTHWTIHLWADGEQDRRTLHIYNDLSGSTDLSMSNAEEFTIAVDEATFGKRVDPQVLYIAEGLLSLKRQMNAIDALAVQAPGTPYQHVTNALHATIAKITDDMALAVAIADAVLDSGESVGYILRLHGYRTN